MPAGDPKPCQWLGLGQADAEGRGRQSGGVEELGGGIILPRVADPDGAFDGGAGDDDGLAIDAGGGGDELAIGGGDLEAAEGGVAGDESGGVVEPDAEGAGVGGDLAGLGSGVLDGFAVGEGAGGEGEAGADGL